MTVKADRKLFPALIGTGVAMTLGFLGPCGFNTPHTHPRSAEINVCVQGNLVAEFQGENGETPITNNITQFQMTVFPQGAMHTEFNPDCTESIFVAGFASEDVCGFPKHLSFLSECVTSFVTFELSIGKNTDSELSSPVSNRWLRLSLVSRKILFKLLLLLTPSMDKILSSSRLSFLLMLRRVWNLAWHDVILRRHIKHRMVGSFDIEMDF